MQMNKIANLIIGTALWTTTTRAGDWTQNLYISADVGSAFRPDTIFHESFGTTDHTTYNAGIRADIGIGYNVNKSWAVELDTGVIWNSIDKVNGVPLSSFNETFDTYLIPNLVNVIYKVPTKSPLAPYVGVGVGSVVSIADINAGNFHGSNPDLSDSDYTFAYQAEAGLNYNVSKRVSFGVDYKFLGMLSQSWYIRSFYNHIETDAIYAHTVLVNFSLRF
jgi:opacity protein-like surface antigen